MYVKIEILRLRWAEKLVQVHTDRKQQELNTSLTLKANVLIAHTKCHEDGCCSDLSYFGIANTCSMAQHSKYIKGMQ